MNRVIVLAVLIAAISGHRSMAGSQICISTTKDNPWSEQPVILNPGTNAPEGAVVISVNPKVKFQTMDGFGGCFNELGWQALLTLPADQREGVMRALFDPSSGCGFEFGRMPIGASDFAKSWYSLDDTPGDYALEHFTIERDLDCLIPYIKAGLAVNPRLKIWGSAWSPPAWMKENNDYRFGSNTMRFEPQVLSSYAHYLADYVDAYQKAGVPVYAVHVQNEPASTQTFPSCLWSGDQIRDFVRDYMGPYFKKNHVKAEIWLGTINAADTNKYAVPVLSDAKAASYITGVGYQWDGQHAIAATHAMFPRFKLMQTETECGGGENNWSSAVHTWGLMDHYLTNWAGVYMYWNMVLDQKSVSSWGWKQNAMVTVNTETHDVRYNPEFYLMKHFGAFVTPGAKRIEATGPDTLAFQNHDGSIVIVKANLDKAPLQVEFQLPQKTLSVLLPANSFSTIIYR